MSALDPSTVAKGPAISSGIVRWVAFSSGFATMMLEVTIPRLFQPWFGASVFVWTNIIAVVMVALSLGYSLGARLSERNDVAKRATILLAIVGVWASVAIFLVPTTAGLLLPSPEALAATDQSASHFELGSFAAVALIFGVPFVLLGALSPMLIRLASDADPVASRAAARVLLFGTIGSFLGTTLPTYVFVPWIGSRGTLIAVTLIALQAAACIGRKSLAAKSRILIFGIVALAAATGSFGARGVIRPALAGETLLQEIESPYQYVRVTERTRDGRNERLLHINEGLVEYHSVELDARKLSGGRYYDMLALAPGLFDANRRLKIAVLGGGSGTLAALLLAHWADRIDRIVTVEIDHSVASAWRDLRLDESAMRSERVTISTVDGRLFLAQSTEKFDIVYVDAYARQTDVPFHLATEEFFRLIADRTTADGVVAINVSVGDLDDLLLQSLVATSAASHPHRFCAPVDGFPNIAVFGRKTAPITFAATTCPDALSSVLAHARRFGSVASTNDSHGRVLTDDHAPVEFLTATR
jgi:predicted membrane-bound spermidine synthase